MVQRKDRFWTFYVGIPALLLTIVAIGFAPTFYLRRHLWPRPDEFFLRHGPDLPVHLVIHGVVLTIWFVLAFLQPSLVAAHRMRLHRRFGVAGAIIAVGVVFTGLTTVVLRDAPRIGEVSGFRAAGNLISLVGFSVCTTVGIWYRSRPADHRTLMTIASIWVVGPAATRLAISFALATSWFSPDRAPVFTFVVILSFLAAVVARDVFTERRLRAGTTWGLLSIVIAVGSILALIGSGAWIAFVGWFA